MRTTYPNVLLTLTNVGYAVGYDEVRKNPAWVAYRLFKVENPTSGKRPRRFKVDHRTQAKLGSLIIATGADHRPVFAVVAKDGDKQGRDRLTVGDGLKPRLAFTNEKAEVLWGTP